MSYKYLFKICEFSLGDARYALETIIGHILYYLDATLVCVWYCVTHILFWWFAHNMSGKQHFEFIDC